MGGGGNTEGWCRVCNLCITIYGLFRVESCLSDATRELVERQGSTVDNLTSVDTS